MTVLHLLQPAEACQLTRLWLSDPSMDGWLLLCGTFCVLLAESGVQSL